MRETEVREVGAVGRLTGHDIVHALRFVRQGKCYDLDAGRFMGMPQWPGHPTYTITTFRTPAGQRATRDLALLSPERNPVGSGILSELLVTGMHVGTHIDALCHVTDGEDRWYGDYSAALCCGDFGPLRADAASIPPIITRGVLLDVAAFLGVPRLQRGFGVDADLLKEVSKRQGTAIAPLTTVLIRTGLMTTWPDRTLFAENEGAGLTLSAARWLVDECEVVLLGSDTPALEQVPSSDQRHPQPVHDFALRQRGVHILENAHLEALSENRVYEFAFICLPLKLSGATGSFVRPIALV
jgi:kynurenine formamidase